jgi:hypothetical protein
MAIKFDDITEDDAGTLKFFIQDIMAGEIFDGGNNGLFKR